MTTDLVYLDTSAYLAVLLMDPRRNAFYDFLNKKSLCSSVLLVIEAERNLVRFSREKILSDEEYRRAMDCLEKDGEHFLLKELSLDICLTGIFPPVRIPKSSDLVHLRTARWFHENQGLAGFVTLDRDQAFCARDFGLPVLSTDQ
ncbi:MAG: hypothetical protein HY538_08870 [Deltaproteobacteria bacterium]|nr:hypothetical protein [Deltaproteobacteria bacterium]